MPGGCCPHRASAIEFRVAPSASRDLACCVTTGLPAFPVDAGSPPLPGIVTAMAADRVSTRMHLRSKSLLPPIWSIPVGRLDLTAAGKSIAVGVDAVRLAASRARTPGTSAKRNLIEPGEVEICRHSVVFHFDTHDSLRCQASYTEAKDSSQE